MKIALINSEYPSATGLGQGGIATYTYTMAQALRDQGHTVHVFVRQGTNANQIPNDIKPQFYGYSAPQTIIQRIINRFRPNNISWEKGHALSLYKMLVELHKKNDLDIAEFPEFGGTSYYCKQPMHFPIVTNFHMPTSFVDQLNNTQPDKNRITQYNLEEFAIKNATAYRSPSVAMKKEISALYGIHPKEITVIPNPVSTKPFDSVIKNHSTDIRFHILFIGRLERRKGAELLQKTIKDILRIDDRVNITIAGETEMHDAAGYRQAIERSLNDEQRQRVWFLGAVDRRDLFILYCRSSILLAPSLFENAPYSILESMAANLPIVASSSGGIPEILTHNKTGLLFNTKKRSTMVTCIKTFFDNPQLASELALEAYNHVTQTFSPELIAKQTISFYESVIN